MSFITSFFSCCFSNTEDEKAEAEARHARIVNMYASGSDTPESMVLSPPPCYADIAHDRPVICSDEKDTPTVELQPQCPPLARRTSVSSRSSIVSVPSTRLSDLTSLYTGATHRSRTRDGERDDMSEVHGSWRSSGWYGTNESAPPSYYAGSERSITPTLQTGSVSTAPSVSVVTPTSVTVAVSAPPAVFAAQHPVMQDGWLEGLRNEAEDHRLPRQVQIHCNGYRRRC